MFSTAFTALTHQNQMVFDNYSSAAGLYIGFDKNCSFNIQQIYCCLIQMPIGKKNKSSEFLKKRKSYALTHSVHQTKYIFLSKQLFLCYSCPLMTCFVYSLEKHKKQFHSSSKITKLLNFSQVDEKVEGWYKRSKNLLILSVSSQ